MIRLATIAIAASVLSGCSAYDRAALTTFEPIGSDHFRFKAFADNIYPLDSPGGEQERIGWLQEYLTDNKFCLSGYVIDERKVVVKVKGALGTVYDLFYSGHCLRA